jgi:hypothetical protein
MASPNSTLPNDEKEAQDSLYNPGEQRTRELDGTHDTIPGYDRANDGLDAIDPDNNKSGGEPPDSAAGVRDAEDKGDWSSSYGGNKSRKGQKITAGNFRAILKKRGPLAAIITLVLGGGIGAGVLFGPSLLLVQIQESFLNAFDSQNTSLTIRTNKILTNKLVEDNTSGACKLVQIACKFSRPSNKLLTNLEKNGVLAFDADGNQVKKDGLFQTTRPSKYTFDGKDISAKDFAGELRSNAAFRSAFHKAYNPRFVGFTDSVFQGIQKRFGFDTSNKAAEDGTKKTSDRLNEASKGVNAVASEGAEEGAEGFLKKMLATKAGQVVSKIAQGGKGDTFGLIAGAVCTATDIPGMVISVVRAYQLVQVINYSMQFLTAGSALKAGTITQEQLSALGGLLTTVVAGKTAMDSFGMRYAMFGDLSSSSKSYQKFIPGGSVSTSGLGTFNQVTSSATKKATCDVATSPATGAAINVGLAVAGPETLGASLAVAAVNISVSWLASEFISQVGVPLIEKAVAGIDVKPLMQFFLGDLTQNLSGMDVGDALASGASNVMGQTANAGGNMPLTVDQAVAYHQTTQDVNLAYAQEDQATLSPLDPTNPNTFVGSIVGKLVPYFASITSVSSAFSSLASIPSGSLSTLLSSTTASAASAQQYSVCPDPAISNSGVAAGPFCNVEYGIPTQWINLDPQTVVSDLLASKDIDPDTGEPIDKGSDDHNSSLFAWINFCTDGTTDNLKGCEVVDKKTAEYSLYIMDHRIQKSMDESDSDGSDGESSSSQNGTDTSDNTDIQALLNSSLAAATANMSTEPIVVAPLSTSIAKPENATLNSSSTGTVASTYKPRINQGWYWTAA